MPNPILEQANKRNQIPMNNNNLTEQLIQQIQQFSQLTNPQIALNQMMMNNPNIREIINFIHQNGNNPQTAFYMLAKQKGIDINKIKQALQNQI